MHGLYDAVLYVYNRGMSDYVTPLVQLLAILKSAVDSGSQLTYQQAYIIVFFIILQFSHGSDWSMVF